MIYNKKAAEVLFVKKNIWVSCPENDVPSLVYYDLYNYSNIAVTKRYLSM